MNESKLIFSKYIWLILVISLFYSCNEPDFLDIEDSNFVERAKNWQKTTGYVILKNPSIGIGTEIEVPIIANWNNSFSSKFNGISIVEVELKSKGILFYSLEDFGNDDVVKTLNGKATSLSRLVIIEMPEDEMEGYIMTFIGNSKYLQENNNSLWKNSFVKTEESFSGLVLFHNLDGIFLKGEIYQKGEKLKYKNTKSMRFEEVVCDEYIIWMNWLQCTEYFNMGELLDGDLSNPISTDCNYASTVEGSIEICYDDGEEQPEIPDGGGPGGNPPSGDPSPSSRCSNDPLYDMTLSDHSNISHWKMAIPGCERSGTFCRYDNSTTNKHHDGYDLEAEVHTPVFPIMDGEVYEVRDDENSSGYGNYIIVRSGAIYVMYAHLETPPPLQRGDLVDKSTQFAWSGESDTQNAPHLHIEARINVGCNSSNTKLGECFYWTQSPSGFVDVQNYMGTQFDKITGNAIILNNCN